MRRRKAISETTPPGEDEIDLTNLFAAHEAAERKLWWSRISPADQAQIKLMVEQTMVLGTGILIREIRPGYDQQLKVKDPTTVTFVENNPGFPTLKNQEWFSTRWNELVMFLRVGRHSSAQRTNKAVAKGVRLAAVHAFGDERQFHTNAAFAARVKTVEALVAQLLEEAYPEGYG